MSTHSRSHHDIYIAPAAFLIGLILFLASKTNADLKEIGRITFAFGLLVTLMMFEHAHPLVIP